MHEVLNKPWSENGLDTLIKMIDNTGGTVTDRTNVIEVAGKHILNNFSRIAVWGEMLCDC